MHFVLTNQTKTKTKTKTKLTKAEESFNLYLFVPIEPQKSKIFLLFMKDIGPSTSSDETKNS